MTTIVMAEDHAVLRDGMIAALQAYDEFSIIGQTGDGLEAIQLTKTLKPDILLLDIRLPSANGIEVLEELYKRGMPTKVLIFTQYYQTEAYVRAALAFGASGYFVKNDGLLALVEALQQVASGAVYLSPRISHYVVEGYRTDPEHPTRTLWETLPVKERTLLKLLAEGKKTAEIAAELSFSKRTVETYRTNIMKKLKLKNLPELVRYAIEHDLV